MEKSIKDFTIVIKVKIIIITEVTVIFILIQEEEVEEIKSYLMMIIHLFSIPFFIS